MAHLLLIDDEAPIRASLKEILEYEGHKVSEAGTGMDGVIAATKTRFDAIFCDVKMPQMDGLDVLDMLAKKNVTAPVVMISGHGTVETAVQSLKKGAYDFIQKPLDLNRVLVTLRNVLEREALVETTKVLTQKANAAHSHQIVGESEAIRHILTMVETVAPTDARVLITGSNGSGKELVARQVHNQSSRAEGPFVEVNCAAIPSELTDKQWDVVRTIGQRWNVDGNHCESMVQIFSEFPRSNGGLQVFVGGGNHTDIDCDVFVASDAGDFVLLQRTQHLGLGRSTHVPHLIQKQRSTLGLFEFAFAL